MAKSGRKNFEGSKHERFLSTREKLGERRYDAFRPYHVRRAGKRRFGAYDMQHCSQAVYDGEKIEAFFHAQVMRKAGYHVQMLNPTHWRCTKLRALSVGAA